MKPDPIFIPSPLPEKDRVEIERQMKKLMSDGLREGFIVPCGPLEVLPWPGPRINGPDADGGYFISPADEANP